MKIHSPQRSALALLALFIFATAPLSNLWSRPIPGTADKEKEAEKNFMADWQLKMNSFARSTQTMLKTKEQVTIDEMEIALDQLETKLGPIIFKRIPQIKSSEIFRENTWMLKKLYEAIQPFHKVTLDNAKTLSDQIEDKGSVNAAAFRNLDRALFGYQAILRKLLSVEDIYSSIESQHYSNEVHLQVYTAKAITVILAADLYAELFLKAKTRRMVQDLLNEERPLAKAYKKRNKEIHAQFVRALSQEMRAELADNLGLGGINYEYILSDLDLERAKKFANARTDSLYLNFSDELHNGLQSATYELSKIFGKVAGNVKFRKGHFWLQRNVTQYLAKHLRPFDILFDKAPFGLSDRFIPGHYTHAAIYLGTKDQLEQAGLWDHQALNPYRKDIEEGKVIVEALRPGTKMSYLHEFQNVDEIAAYRVKNILDDPLKLLISLDTLMAQIGKDYDFNFDVSTTSAIVCSELVYHSLAQIHWPTEFKVGRETISPDNLAVLAYYENAPIELLFDIYGEKKGEIKERTNEEVGNLLGFTRTGQNTYQKVGQYCFNEVQSHIRVGSRRSRYLEMRKCNETLTPLVYK